MIVTLAECAPFWQSLRERKNFARRGFAAPRGALPPAPPPDFLMTNRCTREPKFQASHELGAPLTLRALGGFAPPKPPAEYL